MSEPLPIGVLVSGAGTNLRALIDLVHGREVRIVGVASDRPSAPALGHAEDAGIETAAFPLDPGESRSDRDARLAGWMAERGVGLVVLAGYMQLLSPRFLDRFPDAVINVHPSLLPAFPGLGAIEQALAYGARVFGVSVHFVDAGIDTGPLILQEAVALPAALDPEEVLAALRPLEHALLPEAVRLFARGALCRDPENRRRVLLAGREPMTRACISSESVAPADTTPGDGEDAVAPGAVRVRRAVLSVSDKRGIIDFARGLAELGVEIVSTGGTARELAGAGIAARPIDEFTGFPEIMDGRVKTLHPKLYAGLLAVRENPEHMRAAASEEIEFVDLVCVNLYPFEQTVARRGTPEVEVIENIDIGGPTMIRAAAKNHAYAAAVVRPESYDAILDELREGGGHLSMATRESLAAEAFAYTARYETAIARWFAEKGEDFPSMHVRAYEKVVDLPYGENPHQRAAYYRQVGSRAHLLSMVRQHQGKQLSFNNLLDLDAVRLLISEFDGPACVIVKHNNPCGCALGASGLEAYGSAFECDPMSAFGGVIAFNTRVDRELAQVLSRQFVEVVVAPGFDDDALEVFAAKPNVRVLENAERRRDGATPEFRQVLGGLLVQDRDLVLEERDQMTVVTQRAPTEAQWRDLVFAWRVCKHVRSNAIVLANGGATVGIGAGQMSRVDSVRLAVDKSREGTLSGASLASDAYFPFADGPELAIEAGVSAIIQPGGSIRDDEVIAAADRFGAAMVVTARRHFRH